MKFFLLAFFLFTSFLWPSSTFASHVELKPCIAVAHCVREQWDVSNIENPFEEIISNIQNTPRTEIVEINGDYLHAEATTRWMKYVDDLEVSYLQVSSY